MNIFNAFYSIIIILVALYSLARGFRYGITRQLASLLGLAFGAVTARVLTPQFNSYFLWSVNFSQAPEFADFTVNLVSCVVIYSLVYIMFSLLSPILRFIFKNFEVGILNRIVGAFFSLFKNLLWVSIVLNLLLCYSSNSGLLYYERSNDGNLVGAVMGLTSVALGCYSAEDFAIFHQLKEAKTISYNSSGNFNTIQNVIFKDRSVFNPQKSKYSFDTSFIEIDSKLKTKETNA